MQIQACYFQLEEGKGESQSDGGLIVFITMVAFPPFAVCWPDILIGNGFDFATLTNAFSFFGTVFVYTNNAGEAIAR